LSFHSFNLYRALVSKLVKAQMKEDFEKIVVEYQRTIYNLCYRFLGNHADASEAMQKTFLKAYEKLETFKGMSSMKTWIYKIGLNICRNHLRDRKHNVELDVNKAYPVKNSDPAENAIENEKRQALYRALLELPFKQREAVCLRIYEDQSFSEIARITGRSINTLKVNFHHGLKKLKKILS